MLYIQFRTTLPVLFCWLCSDTACTLNHRTNLHKVMNVNDTLRTCVPYFLEDAVANSSRNDIQLRKPKLHRHYNINSPLYPALCQINPITRYSRSLMRSLWQSISWVKIFINFYENCNLLLCSVQSSTGTYPEPDESIPHLHTVSPKMSPYYKNIIYSQVT
jgi:hypothetical protein